MPAHGNQHRNHNAAAANPFEEEKPHISEFTAQEIAVLQSRLNKRLGPEFISTRAGPGNQKIAYLSAEKAINLANEVFGFNGWNSSIQNIQIDFVDENAQSGKVSIGLSVVVRVTLKDGTFHEDIGYGGTENCKGKAMAFEKAKKEATTDALKRTLRNFGNVLGNCIYDKDYVTKVSKVKVGTTKFDVNDLYRLPEFAPKQEDEKKPVIRAQVTDPNSNGLISEDGWDLPEIDDVDFDDASLSRPDEILLPPETSSESHADQPRPGLATTPSRYTQDSREALNSGGVVIAPGHQPIHHAPTRPQPQPQPTVGHQTPVRGPGSLPRPAGFYSARAAENIDQNNVSAVPVTVARFNPHSQSPSIRKTAGVDHNKSVPVKRDALKPEPSMVPKDVVDPKTEQYRRIGMPAHAAPAGAARSPRSTSAYRPPTRQESPAVTAGHREAAPQPPGPLRQPPPTHGTGGVSKRAPLSDLSNVPRNVTATTADGADAKRQRTSDTGPTIGTLSETENTAHVG